MYSVINFFAIGGIFVFPTFHSLNPRIFKAERRLKKPLHHSTNNWETQATNLFHRAWRKLWFCEAAVFFNKLPVMLRELNFSFYMISVPQLVRRGTMATEALNGDIPDVWKARNQSANFLRGFFESRVTIPHLRISGSCVVTSKSRVRIWRHTRRRFTKSVNPILNAPRNPTSCDRSAGKEWFGHDLVGVPRQWERETRRRAWAVPMECGAAPEIQVESASEGGLSQQNTPDESCIWR